MAIRRQTRTQQPQQVVEPDWSNSITNGLVALTSLYDSDLMGIGKPSTQTGVQKAGLYGLNRTYTGGAKKTQWPANTAFANSQVTAAGSSVLLLFDLTSLTNFGGLISLQDTTTTKVAYEIRVGTSATDSKISLVRAHATSFASGDTGANRLVAGQTRIRMLVTFPDNNTNGTATVWINGTPYSVSIVGSVGTVAAPTSNGLCLGGRSTDTTTVLDGAIYLFAAWNRALSPLEANDLTASIESPWQLYTPRGRPILLPSTGAPPSGFFSPFPTFRPGL